MHRRHPRKGREMTDLRTAAQQALEALEDIFGANKVDVGAINALRAALAEPVQPVAWLSRDDARLALWEAINRREFGNPTDDKLILDHLHQRRLWIGKYTAPPKRDPLTDEQISDLWHQSGEQPFKFARMLVK